MNSIADWQLSLVHDLPVDPNSFAKVAHGHSVHSACSPRRYPMLLVDRVLELDGDQKAIGIKNVSINEPFFQGHYPNVPIMPAFLSSKPWPSWGGSGLQHGGQHREDPVLLSLDGVKIRKPVTPGDQLVLEAETIQFGPESFRSAVEQPWREPLRRKREFASCSSRRTASIDA